MGVAAASLARSHLRHFDANVAVTSVRLECLHTVDSTNDEAMRRLRTGEIDGPTCLVARCQTSGRGTSGRRWLSPLDAGIYMSVVHLPTMHPLPMTTEYTRQAGMACAEVLGEMLHLPVEIKPINDLILGGGKLGGILTEMLVEEGRATAVITGVGINLRYADRPVGADALPPTSLQEHLSAEQFQRLDCSDLVERLAARVLARFECIGK